MTQTILSPEQIQLLKQENINHSFLDNKSQNRRLNRMLKHYNFGLEVLWNADYHILVLAWLTMKQSKYRNLQGQNPADLIKADLDGESVDELINELIDYPTYNDGYKERIKQFYMTMPQVLTNAELSWFFHHMYNILYRYSKDTIVDLTLHTYDIKTDYINLKGDQIFIQSWLLERLNAIQKNNNPKDIYKLFAVWQHVNHDFWWFSRWRLLHLKTSHIYS